MPSGTEDVEGLFQFPQVVVSFSDTASCHRLRELTQSSYDNPGGLMKNTSALGEKL